MLQGMIGTFGFGGELGMVIDPEKPLIPEGLQPQDTGEPFKTSALEEARKRLRENADCAKLFGGLKNALKKLDELKFHFGYVDRDIAKIEGKNVIH